MIDQDDSSLSRFVLWSVFVICILLLSYVLFVSVTSIFIGLSHPDQDGFWVPVAAGIITILVSILLVLMLSRFIRHKLKGQESINLSS